MREPKNDRATRAPLDKIFGFHFEVDFGPLWDPIWSPFGGPFGQEVAPLGLLLRLLLSPFGTVFEDTRRSILMNRLELIPCIAMRKPQLLQSENRSPVPGESIRNARAMLFTQVWGPSPLFQKCRAREARAIPGGNLSAREARAWF